MLKITDLHAELANQSNSNNTPILRGIDLSVSPGEIHVIQGANGSGKSTLASVIAGNPRFSVSQGKLELVAEDYPEFLLEKLHITKSPSYDLLAMEPDVRANLGIFLAHQYPLEIPGLEMTNFLRLSYNQTQSQPLPVFKFRKLLAEKVALLNYPDKLITRNLNEGFSGGEKKKTEILQMAVLNPRYAILDETDSGLDKQAIHDVFAGINTLRNQNSNLALIVITHYDKVLEYLQPDYLHTLSEGKIIKSEHISK